MSTKFSLRELFKSRRSKRAGNPEQNGRHSRDGPTTPPAVSETPACDAEISMAPKLSQPQNPSIVASVNEEDSTKAASSSVTELQAPSNSPTTDAQQTPASPDVGAKKPRPPASAVQETSKTASSSHVAQAQDPTSVVPVTDTQTGPAEVDPQVKEPQPATEFAVQQTQAISTSQRLWNDAYDNIENDNKTAELVKAYVKTLMMVLTSASRTNDVSTELKDPTKR